MDPDIRKITRRVVGEGLQDKDLAELISKKQRAGKLDDEKLAIINSLTPATVKELLTPATLEPIIDRQSLNEWFRRFIQLSQKNPEVIGRSLVAMVRDMITEMEKTDVDLIKGSNMKQYKQDPERRITAEKALLFLEKHLNSGIDDDYNEFGNIISRLRQIANSYPGSDEEIFGRAVMNHATEAIRLSLIIFHMIKIIDVSNVALANRARALEDMLNEVIETYIVNSGQSIIKPEAYDNVRRVIASEILPWILGVRDPVKKHLNEQLQIEEGITQKQTGMRWLIVGVLEKLKIIKK